MKKCFIILPNQLFKETLLLEETFDNIFFIEEELYFKQFKFHKQKLLFHRLSMNKYKEYLAFKGIKIEYINSKDKRSDIRVLQKDLAVFDQVHLYHPHDNYFEKRIGTSPNLSYHESPSFINQTDVLNNYFTAKKKPYRHHDFYVQQRKNFNIMIENDGKPTGGNWSYDKENRKKYPKNKLAPAVPFYQFSQAETKEKLKIEVEFKNNYGSLSVDRIYPITFEEAEEWFELFLIDRFHEFGIYEDAITSNNHFLNHSILSPLINSGLLTPKYVVNKAIDYGFKHDIPISSIEGFIRQIIGWREFILGLYEHKGSYSRTKNFWNHQYKMPKSCYEGTTGIIPVDQSIKKLNNTAYNHHIERLMILGNFFLLTEINPNEVYKWFMEMYIDAYDWVMVPNVYGMSQFADGGLFATKPYISGSNYILKMSDYKKGDWSEIWNALFWRFMIKNEEFFRKNYRMNMLLSTFHKRDQSDQDQLLDLAENFLQKFHK